jgi:hypothetical protein
LHCLNVDGHCDCPDLDTDPDPVTIPDTLSMRPFSGDAFFQAPCASSCWSYCLVTAADFDAFYADPIAAQESNSGFGRFQKVGAEATFAGQVGFKGLA